MSYNNYSSVGVKWSMYVWTSVFPAQLFLINSVFANTLSLQGNIVFNPVRTIEPTRKTLNLKECARICMENARCKMFIYDTNNLFCQMATTLSPTPTRTLNKYELAYLRGLTCAKDRRMELRTQKMGRFFNTNSHHYYMPTFAHGRTGMTPEDPLFCHAMEDIPGCDVVSFGSATGGIRLTTNTRLPNYVHYGFCAQKHGTCNADVQILEYKVGDDFLYVTRDYIKTGSGTVLCNFWGTGQKQCTPGANSIPYKWVFQKKY